MTTMVRLSAALAAVMVFSAAHAAPPLEQLLDRAMRANPDIVAARAQAELAKAELNLAQMKVAREIVALHSRSTAQTRNIQLIREQLKESPKDQNVLQTLINAEAQLAEIQAQMSYLIGQPMAGQSAVAPAVPHGPIFEKVGKALASTVSFDFSEVPLGVVGSYLGDLLGLPINVDKSVSDIPITLNLKDVSFAAATQGLQDTCPQIRFVVRDYGILVTSSDFAARAGFISVSDFGKHLAGQSQDKKPEPTPEPKREIPQ